MKGVRRPWTQEDDQRLKRELLAGVPIDEVAKNLGRTRSSIESRAPLLRIALNKRIGHPSEKRMDHLPPRQFDLRHLRARK